MHMRLLLSGLDVIGVVLLLSCAGSMAYRRQSKRRLTRMLRKLSADAMR